MENQCWYGIEIEKKKEKKKTPETEYEWTRQLRGYYKCCNFVKSLDLYRERRSIIISYLFTQSVFLPIEDNESDLLPIETSKAVLLS